MHGGSAATLNEAQVLETLREEFFPAGVLSAAAARALIAQYAPHGRVATRSGIETLTRVIEMANDTPALLPAFLVGQLCAAVIAGEGPALGRRPHFSRVLDAEDIALLRRVLEAGAGASGMPVSRAEAEALFDLHDATAGGANDPGFDELFYRAVASHLLAASGHAVPHRRAALASETPLPRAPLDPEQAAWLAERIMRDGRATTAELMLLALIGEECDVPDRSVRKFIDFAA